MQNPGALLIIQHPYLCWEAFLCCLSGICALSVTHPCPLAPPESSAMASNFLVKGYKIHEGSNANTNQDGPLGHLPGHSWVGWLM